MEIFSFRRAWGQVKTKDQAEVKKKIMSTLGIKTRAAWRSRLEGLVEPRISEAQAIEEVFGNYGITDIWGYETEECSVNEA